MGKRQYGDYYIGLDMGSTSVGWAATDMNYDLLKMNGKAMWGTRLFEEAKTAAERRVFRIARRRIERRNCRLALLQDLFRTEVDKVDPGFFQRLSESALYPVDRKLPGRNSIFNDPSFSDKEYHIAYPTIYHLRAELASGAKPHDIRLVYLALHHILKYRGHFLFEGESVSDIMNLKEPINTLSASLRDECDVEFTCDDVDAVSEVLKDRSLPRSIRQKQLTALFNASTAEQKELVKALLGAKFKLSVIFGEKDGGDGDIASVDFSDGKYEDIVPQLQAQLGDQYIVLDRLRAIYNWSIMADILRGRKFLSEAKVSVYEKHRADLCRLKRVMRRYASKDVYVKMFSDPSEPANYCAYSGHAMKNRKHVPIEKRCTRDAFYASVRKLIKGFELNDNDVKLIAAELESGTFWIVNPKSDKNYKVQVFLNSAGDRYPSVPCSRMLLNQ